VYRGLQRDLSWLTNSALIYESNGGGIGGFAACGVSANEYSCAHHVTWSPNKLLRSTILPTSILTYMFVKITDKLQFSQRISAAMISYTKHCAFNPFIFNPSSFFLIKYT